MGSIDFNLPIRKQLYVLPNTKLLTNEEKDIILNFVWIQYTIFFRKESINRSAVSSGFSNKVPTKGDVEDMINSRRQNLTFEIAIRHLLKEAEKLQNKQLIKRVEELKKQLENTALNSTIIITRTHYTKLDEKEYQIGNIMAFIESSLILDLMPISDVSKRINVSDDTIRQACRAGRIMARKFTNTWFVSLEECKEYWNDTIMEEETSDEE